MRMSLQMNMREGIKMSIRKWGVTKRTQSTGWTEGIKKRTCCQAKTKIPSNISCSWRKTWCYHQGQRMCQQKLTKRIYYKIRDKLSYSITRGNAAILCIEAKENRYMVLTDISAAILQMEMNKEVHMLLERVNRQNRAKTIQETYME